MTSHPIQRWMNPLTGSVIDGRYHVHGMLGEGGVGHVYEAVHEKTGRRVALKVLRRAPLSDDEAIERLAREARTAGSLGHPNVVEVLDAATLPDGRPYIVMELLEGEALAERLDRVGCVSPQCAAEIVQQAAAALDALHARGVVHRDVKPENLFITREGVVKLLDFGLVGYADPPRDARRITADGVVNGTPEYMGPEVFDDTRPSAAGDVYALTVVAFEMLTGLVPFDAENPFDTLFAKRRHRAPSMRERCGVRFGAALEVVVARGLERKPDRRWPTAGAFAAAFAEAVSRAEPPEGELDERPMRMRRTTWLTGAAVAGALVVGGIGGATVGVVASGASSDELPKTDERPSPTPERVATASVPPPTGEAPDVEEPEIPAASR